MSLAFIGHTYSTPELDGSHSFDNGLIFGGSFVYTDDAFSDRANQNLEGTIGYRVPLDRVFSVWGSAAVRDRPHI